MKNLPALSTQPIPALLLAVCLAGCSQGDEKDWHFLLTHTTPHGPFDSIRASFWQPPEDDSLVVMSDGLPVLFDPPVREGNDVIWTPSEPWSGGSYTIDSVAGFPPKTRHFDMIPYGYDRAFTGLNPGDAYRIGWWNEGVFRAPRAFSSHQVWLLTGHEVVLEILDVEGSEVSFRLVHRSDDTLPCAAHQGKAMVDKFGRFAGSNEIVTFPLLGSEGTVYDLQFEGGVVDGVMGNLSMQALLDVSPFAPLFDPPTLESLCSWDGCLPCPNGTVSCLEVQADRFEGTLDPTWRSGAPLPTCDIPVPDSTLCEPISCSSHGTRAGWVLAPLLLGLMRRRRRAQAGQMRRSFICTSPDQWASKARTQVPR